MFENLNPMDRPTAIMEIIIMLLVAFILGFILAWILKRSKTVVDTSHSTDLSNEIDILKRENKNLLNVSQSSEAEIKQLESDLNECKKNQAGLKNQNQKEIADLKLALSKCNDSLIKEQQESTTTQDHAKSSAEAISVSDEENAKKLGFKAVKSDVKDDLTKIKGIGPFIEKKLNNLGIYTFDQISEFTPDTITKVTEAIEFFPGRIERDNWVDQANDLK